MTDVHTANTQYTTERKDICCFTEMHCIVITQQFTYTYVTLWHLRSKEFQRIHLPCIPWIHLGVHWNASQESGCTSKTASRCHQAEHGLDVDEVMVPPSVCFIQAQTEIDCGNKLMFTWWLSQIEVLPQAALKWRRFSVLAVLQVGKCYLKVRTSLTVHSQAFQHVFECRHVHITDDMS